MTTTQKCRAKGGPAACTNPNCPDRQAFTAPITQVTSRRTHTSPLPSGWYQAELLQPTPNNGQLPTRDFTRNPLHHTQIADLTRNAAPIPDDLGISRPPHTRTLDRERTATALPAHTIRTCWLCNTPATWKVSYLGEDAPTLEPECLNTCEKHLYNAFS